MLHELRRARTIALLCGLALALPFSSVLAQPTTPRDGQRDFDFEIGSWRTQLRRLAKPLSGDTTWVEYAGTTVVRKVWEALGPHEKASFRSLLVGFPADAKLLNMDPRGRIRGRLFPQPSVPR